MTSDAMPDSGTRSGLRERKKLATRQALTWAAVRLAVERGLDNVRVEDIAAEAGVSPRTFNNYFSSKHEAVVARHLDRTRHAAAVLRARPESEPLWDAVVHAVLSPYVAEDLGEQDPPPDWTARIRLMFGQPALRGEVMKAGVAAENEFAAAVAERTVTDVDRDFYPRLVAATVGAAVQVATDQWLRADPPVPLLPLLRDAVQQVAAGLPDPSADRPANT